MTTEKISIAVSADFFTAFASIPRRQQGKVLTFINKFRTDPTLPGYNYEKIDSARDKRFRSVRIDDTYRCILLKPDQDNVYMLLWVDHHDEAYAWAQNRICRIAPDTGGIQIIAVQEQDIQERKKEDKPGIEAISPSRWLELSSDELYQLGIPPEMHEQVRSLDDADGLAGIKEFLPALSYEALHFFESGESIADVLELYASCVNESDEGEVKGAEDIATALDNPFSRQQFWVNPDEAELAAMLDAPLETWRVFLHPSQRTLVERDWNGPVRVLGGAGTGKTVVALHRAKWLAENRCPNKEKILFITFTRTLAVDIQRQLQSICAPETLTKIEVVNLDKWVGDFLRRNAYEFKVDYGEITDTFWEQARAMLPESSGFSTVPTTFFLEEWKYVIQPQEVMTLEDYFSARRVGRTRKLIRRDRKEIWPVFEEFRILLNEQRYRQPADAMREARELLKADKKYLYYSVIVDEAQDMSRQALSLVRALAPCGKNDLFLAGDAHQRIYGQPVALRSSGISITGRGRKLRINYRTTEEIRRAAKDFLEHLVVDDLDGGEDSKDSCVSLLHGEEPRHMNAPTRETLYANIADEILKVRQGDVMDTDICIVARSTRELEVCKALLETRNVETYPLSADQSDNRDINGVRLATMHRVKGLEFEVVFLVNFISKKKRADEDDTRMAKEKSLRYVAASRARQKLIICEMA